jgi:hypothetical protein
MVKRDNTATTQFLVLWKNLPLTEATWENAEEFGWRFPQFHLEDKVEVMEGAMSQTEKKKAKTNKGGS